VYVVTVVFEPRAEHAPAFLDAMIANARASREREPGCRQFDVCVDDAGTVFLYERYDDRAAFDAHLASPHFREFDALTREWIARKDVRIYARRDP
jgi:quinol monooxygenase YgiN